MIVDLGRPGFVTAGFPDTTAQDSYGSCALTAPAALGVGRATITRRTGRSQWLSDPRPSAIRGPTETT
jgi:hypothetical protein